MTSLSELKFDPDYPPFTYTSRPVEINDKIVNQILPLMNP